MPWMSLKSDGERFAAAAETAAAKRATHPLALLRDDYAREVGNGITANSAIAATTISNPITGVAMNEVPFSTTTATRNSLSVRAFVT